MRILIALCLLFFSWPLFADDTSIALEKAPVNARDMASIKRGAQFVAGNCLACHTLIYLRYNKIANDAGVTYERMPVAITKWPFDVRPPDLSVEVSYRGADWVYTYLHSFYQDPSSPTGFNNLLVLNTKMPGILIPYQGLQVKVAETGFDKTIYDHELQWYDVLVLQKQGAMTPQQFDATVTDVVNFLAYAAEPYKVKQQRIGLWVIGFLFILFILMVLLKKEYWKNVK